MIELLEPRHFMSADPASSFAETNVFSPDGRKDLLVGEGEKRTVYLGTPVGGTPEAGSGILVPVGQSRDVYLGTPVIISPDGGTRLLVPKCESGTVYIGTSPAPFNKPTNLVVKPPGSREVFLEPRKHDPLSVLADLNPE